MPRAILYLGDTPSKWVYKDSVDGVVCAPMLFGSGDAPRAYRVVLLVHGIRVHFKMAPDKEAAEKIMDTLRIDLDSGT